MIKKLAVVGSRFYDNFNRISKVISTFIANYGGKNLIIVSGGCPTGADKIAKNIAIDIFGIKYVEFPPCHNSYNKYCLNKPDCYNKPYYVGNFFKRNSEIAEYCDFLIAFILKKVPAKGTMDTVNKTSKLGKLVHIFED